MNDDIPPAGDLGRLVEQRLRAGSHEIYAEALALMESKVLTTVLKATGGNQSEAARLLGMTRTCLRKKIHVRRIQIENLIRVGDQPERLPAGGDPPVPALSAHWASSIETFEEPQA
jgi:DNA-binding protein